MISTRELARLANVSQSTVSRSLHDCADISVETKEKIRALAKQHGYVVRTRASKTVVTQQRRAIGVLMMSQPFFNDIFINQLLSVLYRTIEQENYYAIPLIDYRGEDGIQKIRDFIKVGLVEGFIIINREYDAAIDAYFNEIGIPHLYLIYFARNSSEQVAIVDTDNYLGGYIAAQHLTALGHRNFVTLTSPWDEFYDRTNGFIAGLRDNGLSIPREHILSGDCFYSVGYQLTKENLHLFETATSIYAQADVVAIGAINALQDSGLRVPQDISVIGSDGLDMGGMVRPQLTSVAQPFHDLARVSVERLLEITNLAGKRTIKTKTFLQPELLLRESTASPRV